MTEEIWKYIPGYEGHYQASTEGRIRSVDRWIDAQNQFGPFSYKKKGQVITPSLSNTKGKYNFWSIRLSVYKVREKLSIARLVLLTFIGEPPAEDSVANFKDLNSENYKLSNLEWGTLRKAIRCRVCRGTRKLSIKDVKYIRSNPKNLTQQSLGSMFGVVGSHIHLIQKRKIYEYFK